MEPKTFIHLNNYNFNKIKEKELIFDTNVLVNLYFFSWKEAKSEKNNKYLSILGDIVTDCKIFNKKIKILIPIISEYYNLAFKSAFEDYKNSKNLGEEFTRKDYRNIDIFKDINKSIISTIDEFAFEFEIEHFNFQYLSVLDKEKLLLSLDFTDLIISKYCEEHDACLVTLDKDFRKTFVRDMKFTIISN